MTTLKDLSRHLNLSVTQVSRALNGYADVSEATRARVLAAASELAYQPNLSARKLVSGRSGIVGLVLQGTPASMTGDHFLTVIGGLSAEFSRRELQFVLHMADPEEDVIEVYRRLIDGGGLDGFVLIEPVTDDRRVAYLAQRGIPVIVHGRLFGGPAHAYYDIDNAEVGRVLTRHLLRHGHRRIAFLNGSPQRAYSEARRRGHVEALEEAGLPFDPGLHITASMDEKHGLVSAVKLFSGPAPHPTAVIASHLKIARGLVQGLSALGLRVPDDVSIVAHDDQLSDLAATGFEPPLTTTTSPIYDSWAPLADGLARLIAGAPIPAVQHTAAVDFVERGSVAAPRNERPAPRKNHHGDTR